MEPETQPRLVDMPEQPVRTKEPRSVPPAKLKPIDRDQGFLRPVIVEELVAADHKVRAIWDLTGGLDLSGFENKIRSRKGEAGRSAWDPRLLLSVWLYAYSEQVSSAREIERLMSFEPGLMWLSGLGEVNHHTLSDFRAAHQQELKQLLVQLLAILSQEGFVKLELVAHDGTKIRAQAGADTFRRSGTLETEMAKASEVVKSLEQQGEGEAADKRRNQARQRAARERMERMQQAAEELEQIRKGKKTVEEREQARVSLTEPEARLMKHGDNAITPSYNVQISTDSQETIIVGVHLTQCSSDSGSLLPAMEEMQARLGRYPAQVVADGGFTNQSSIAAMREKGIEFYGSLPDEEKQSAGAMKSMGIDPEFGPKAFVVIEEKKALRCPAGKRLEYVRHSKKRADDYDQYQAQSQDCRSCEYQKRCCPKHAEQGRTVSLRIRGNAEVAGFREKMKGEQARAVYRRRGAIAEFPNCWIKEKFGMRKFRLRGMVKATTEAIWAVLTYDAMQWIRLRPKVQWQAA